ncbi:MAG: hypothetical protein ACOYNI_12080 [Acidimicrobiia bacterium]
MVPPAEDLARIRRVVLEALAGRPLVLVGGSLDFFTPHLHEIRSLGLPTPLVVTSPGTWGAAPADDLYVETQEEIAVDRPGGTVEPDWQRALAHPAPEVQAALDAHDPAHQAVVMPYFHRKSAAIGDRPFYGQRPDAAAALEGKPVASRWLDEIGVSQPGPWTTAPVARFALEQLFNFYRATKHEGVIVSGDGRGGVPAGGRLTFASKFDDASIDRIIERLGPECDALRVAPFVEGQTIAVHGFVTDHGAAVFDPVEVMGLRFDPGKFFCAGWNTAYQLDPIRLEQARSAFQRVADGMAHDFGYRGALTLDMIATERGIVVNDVNPRPGGGFRWVSELAPELPANLLHYVLAEGQGTDVHPETLEAIVADARAQRSFAQADLWLDGPPNDALRALQIDGVNITIMQASESSTGLLIDFNNVAPGARLSERLLDVAHEISERSGIAVWFNDCARERDPVARQLPRTQALRQRHSQRAALGLV